MAQQGLTEPVMRLYTRDILKAVYEIHRHDIVHRDIKGQGNENVSRHYKA